MFVFVDVIVGVLYINIFLILLLSDVWFITIFSNFVEESLNNVFWCIKVFKFDEVQINYFFLFFFAHILDVIPKKPLPCVIHFSTSCIILAVLIRSLIYFQSFFFFSFFDMLISIFSSTICWEDFPFPYWVIFVPLLQIIDLIRGAHFWVLYTIPLVSMSVFMSVPCCSDYCTFILHFVIRKCEFSLFYFFKIVLAI